MDARRRSELDHEVPTLVRRPRNRSSDEAGLISALQDTASDSERKRLRARLVEANFALVVETAKLLRGRGVPFSDLVQEGSLALMAAIEQIAQGNAAEFRKLAPFAIWKRLQDFIDASVDSHTKSRGLLTNALAPDPHLADLEMERIEKAHALLALLAEDQERVLRMRFGIDWSGPVTLEAVARNLGINRWRVSGLESRALAALRRAVHRLRWTFPR